MFQERTFLRCKCSKKKLAAKLSNNVNLVISFNLYYLDAIEDTFFERSGNSSDVTLTEKESVAKQQKKRQIEKFNLDQ